MNDLDFPPFPAMGARGPQVCESVRFYLAIIDDLSLEQVRILTGHIQECAGCAAEFRLLQQATRLIADLPESRPSARVDQAILAAIQNRNSTPYAPVQLRPEKREQQAPRAPRPMKRARPSKRRSGVLTLIAALLLLMLGAVVFWRSLIFPSSTAQAFQLPAGLSWNGYVLHYTQTRTDAHGKPYQIEVYQDLGNNNMHIESSMQGQFDVVVVTDNSTMLGEDMMHHVAQMGNDVENWAIDGSLFELNRLRQDLANHRAVYLGQSSFKGQPVYQIRASNNQVLLLNMQYLPVNALNSSGTGKPLYTTCTLMLSRQVSDSMWDMQVPPGFQMGKLPAKS